MRRFVVKALLMFCFISLLGGDFAFGDSPRETPIVKVVRQNAEAVVNISTERVVYLRERPFWGNYDSEFDFFFDQFFSPYHYGRAMKLKSVGSGVILDSEGIIVTNAHVVNMATSVFVVLNDGTSIEGRVMYENPQDDLAIIKIDSPKPLKSARLGSAEDIMIGETVVAIGNPLGLENTVTRGIISGKNRMIYTSRGLHLSDGLLQTDAPINPGNSGGALLNLDGELIGINVAVVQNSQNIGFAIPVNKVEAILAAYRQNRKLAVGQRSKERFSPVGDYDSGGGREEEWDLFSQLQRMREEMNEMFKDAFDRRQQKRGIGMFDSSFSYDMDYDMQETKDSYIVTLAIPGVNKDKLDVEINKDSISISGERSIITEEEEPNKVFKSKSFSSFVKILPLPADADAGKVKTDVNNNTVVITMPKKRL
ncbi:MAG: trypsin-like peptidase domain-containing protein [Deltaproteobacteria bacterium]|nr:trypsin-like peptidase domain-containing protein [Deltaproteobacteria bacterium]